MVRRLLRMGGSVNRSNADPYTGVESGDAGGGSSFESVVPYRRSQNSTDTSDDDDGDDSNWNGDHGVVVLMGRLVWGESPAGGGTGTTPRSM